MVGKACALAFAERVVGNYSLADATVRAFTCCSDEIAVLYRRESTGVENGLMAGQKREDAFLFSLPTGTEGQSYDALVDPLIRAGTIVVADLRLERRLFFSDEEAWVHFYVPVGLVASLRRFTGDTGGLFLRDQSGHTPQDLHALVATILPVLRHDQPYECNFVENIVMTCVHLLIERHVAERSAESFEKSKMSGGPTFHGLLFKQF